MLVLFWYFFCYVMFYFYFFLIVEVVERVRISLSILNIIRKLLLSFVELLKVLLICELVFFDECKIF